MYIHLSLSLHIDIYKTYNDKHIIVIIIIIIIIIIVLEPLAGEDRQAEAQIVIVTIITSEATLANRNWIASSISCMYVYIYIY